MSFFGFRQSAELDIVLDGGESRRMTEIRTEDGKKERFFLFYDGESVTGKVNVTLRKPGARLEHHGIKIEFIGQIEMYYDRGNHHEFLSLVKELARPGELQQNVSYPFEFNQVEKPYESYTGSNVRLRYLLRVTVVRRLSDLVREMEVAVHALSQYPDLNTSIKMEVGIDDSLHIEFEYNKSKYHLKDVIVGKIYFQLVRIKINHMEIAIIKREMTGSGPNAFNENETIAKYEIMDGAPVRGENIPIRVFLAGYELTPTMRDINKKFSVRYFLNLVLVDEEERRYFKQQEIMLWRNGDHVRRACMTTGGQPSQRTIHTIQQQLAAGNIADRSTVSPSVTSYSGPTTPCGDDDPGVHNVCQRVSEVAINSPPPVTTTDITTDTTTDITTDTTTDTTTDITTDITKDVTTDTTKDVTTDITTKDVTNTTTKDVTTDITKDVTTDITKDVTTDTTKDVTSEQA